MKQVKLFLSYTEEVRVDVEKLQLEIIQKYKNIHIEVFPKSDKSFNKGGYQKRLNEILVECDILYVFVERRIGKFTEEEFWEGWKSFVATKRPHLSIFFKKFQLDDNAIDQEWDNANYTRKFKQKISQLEGNQYLGNYDNFYKLKNDIFKQLEHDIKKITDNQDESVDIAYNKETQEIKQALKNRYPKIEDFKKAILSYLKEDVLNFDEIVNTDDNLKLFQKLLEEKECLYCLLKELNLHEKYASRVKKVEDCSKYKEEIAKKRSIVSIILVIRKSTNDGLDDCMITCHEEKRDGKYNISVRSLSNVDFTNRENYEEAINSLVSDRVNSENILELKLILPEDFFEVDFCTLQIETAFIRKKKLKEVFQISKKILMRFNDYKTVGYFERWKKNQTKYNGLKTEPIEKHIFLVDEENKVSLYGVDITVEDKNEPDYLAVHSFYPLVKKDYIVDMVEYGVPIVMSATKKIEEFSLAWKKSSVCNMKSVLFKNLRYYENRQLIHDNYDEVVWLQEAIEKEKKRS